MHLLYTDLIATPLFVSWGMVFGLFWPSDRTSSSPPEGGALGGSARALGREGRPNGSSVGEDIVGFSAMISALDKAGRWEDSLSLFEEMSSSLADMSWLFSALGLLARSRITFDSFGDSSLVFFSGNACLRIR